MSMTSREQFEQAIKARFGDSIDYRVCKNSDGEYIAWDMQVAWWAWQAASKASEQQLAALAANNALLKGALLEEGYRYFDADTEVTDAYLAEVRAQGVDMYADTLDRGADDAERDGFEDGMKFLRAEAEAVRKFAAQLRQGADHE